MAPPAKRPRTTTRKAPSYARNSRDCRSTSSSSQLEEEEETPSPEDYRTAGEGLEDQKVTGKSPSIYQFTGGNYRTLRQSTLVQRHEPGQFTQYYNIPSSPSDSSQTSETDSDAEEDARIERSMGVIRKKTATRGTEGGTKYHCDVCSVDVTSTVSLAPLPAHLPGALAIYAESHFY